MNTQINTASTTLDDDAILASMLGDLDEVIEDTHTDDTLGAATAVTATAATADEPDEAETVSEKPAKKVKKAAAPKEPKEPKAPKAPRITSITHKAGDRLVALLGGTAWLQFYKFDTPAEADIRAQGLIDAMNRNGDIADKVKDKAIMLMTWIASGADKSQLNEVLLRSFEVLFKDGELTSGKAGNLQVNLLGKPYSPGTAASQSNQMFMLFPLLGITKREKGRMVMDEDSSIVEVMKMKLAA